MKDAATCLNHLRRAVDAGERVITYALAGRTDEFAIVFLHQDGTEYADVLTQADLDSQHVAKLLAKAWVEGPNG